MIEDLSSDGTLLDKLISFYFPRLRLNWSLQLSNVLHPGPQDLEACPNPLGISGPKEGACLTLFHKVTFGHIGVLISTQFSVKEPIWQEV